MRIIDLSHLIENTPSEPMKIEVRRLDHLMGAQMFCRETAGNLDPSDFPDGLFLSLDTVTMTSHMGTHIDAPIHYGPICEGKQAKSVHELPLEWFYAKGVRLDLRHIGKGKSIGIEDIKKSLEAIEAKLEPLTIVLIWTGTDKKWGKKEYFTEAPGMSREAVKWLTEQGIKVIGIDTYGMDLPFPTMLEEFWKTKDQSKLWPAHFFGREKEYIHLERLAHLDLLPDKGFIVSCLPLKIKGIDASWVRAIAILESI